jgi:integrase/recombinase XerD
VSGLQRHVADYLRLRRALGFKLTQPGHVLPQFVAWLEATGQEGITVEAAIRWAQQPAGLAPISRAHLLTAVRGFALYLRTIDPATEIPPNGVFGKQQRRAPYVYSPEEIRRLVTAAGTLHPPLRAATQQTLLGLLAATGMRVGEALRLEDSDVDLAAGLLRVRHGKFDRDRLVPLHSSVTAALRRYAARRDRLRPRRASKTFFVSTTGNPLSSSPVNDAFHRVATTARLPTADGRLPRMHDLRHSFAVHTLIGWQRDGVDVSSRLPVLSAYLGHVSPASTYWYLSAVPELMQLAAAGLDPRQGMPS